MLDFITETNDVWQNMRSCGRPLVLYGMGNGADAILDRMEAEGLTRPHGGGRFNGSGVVCQR